MTATLESPFTGEQRAARKLGSMPMADYLALDALGSSAVKDAAELTPLEWRFKRSEPSGDTDATILGTAIHTAILEPDKLEGAYLAKPDVDGRTKAGKAANAEHKARLAESGGIEISADALEIAREAGRLARQKSKLWAILSKGEVEQVYVARDEATGLALKARLDFGGTIAGVLFPWDLKSARDLDDRSLERAVIDRGYGQQAAHYLDVIGASEPDLAPVWHILWVRNRRPLDLRVTRLDEAWIEHGRRLNRRALDTIAACEASGEWPGHPNRITELGMPGWLRKADQ